MFQRKEQSKTNTPVYNNSRLLCVNEFLFIFKAYKDGKFLFEAKLDIANVCSLSDPEGGLASTWQNQWDAAILQKNKNNPDCELVCVLNAARIVGIEMMFPSKWLETKESNNLPKIY